MRIERLARRMVDAPRFVVIALVGLSLLVSPGFVGVSKRSDHGLEPLRTATGFAERGVAVFALHCREGVLTKACLRLVSRVTEALEGRAEVTGPVESLVRARRVRAQYGALRLDALARPLPESEAALRELRARLRGEAALERRFVAPDGRTTWVYAELARERGARDSRALAESLRASFERPPLLGVTLVGVDPIERSRAPWLFAALALAALAFALAPGGPRAAALAGTGALVLGVFAHALVGLLGEPARASGGWLPGTLAAAALASSLALISRARLEQRREASARASVAAALAALGPALALSALASSAGFAALLALAPGASLSQGLAAGAALAAALVAYPVGVTLPGLIAWPMLLARPPGELAAALSRRVERVLARPRRVACVALAALALVTVALAALAPATGVSELRAVVFDSGTEGGALEPAFLERVRAFQREAEARPGVLWSSSIVDTAIAPANRALHDGDSLFATVPLTRAEVVRALRPWERTARESLAREIDPERRRVRVELLVDPSAAAVAPRTPAALASTALAVALVALLGAAVFRSARALALCAAPAATAGAIALVLASSVGAGPQSDAAALAPLCASLASGLGLVLLDRTRGLLEAGTQLEVALPLAQREAGTALASASLAAASLVAALAAFWSEPVGAGVVAAATPLISAACVLALLPPLVRASRGRYFRARVPLRAEVSLGPTR
ncbi:MAG: hypothetical protein FJ108_08620 [Deltaproteobacteria bacterium]|nr:hypothetical protein [Deltaproteobacteria bacterium]